MYLKSKSLEEKKREADLAFIERIRSASTRELGQMLKDHSHSSTPKWKVAAIERALLKALMK
jgi:hypothetical protein